MDGRDIKDFSIKSLRNKLAYVGKEPILFAMSIRENLLLAKPDATEEQIIDALKQTNSFNFIMKLDLKMDTYVGPGGSQLSGGQK